MIDRRTTAPLLLGIAVLGIAFGAGACLPAAVGPSRSPDAAAVSPDASPTRVPPTPLTTFIPPTPTPMPTFRVYVVVRGDTLTSIARRFGTTARSLAFWNRITYPSLDPESGTYSPNRIDIGWTLYLIPGVVVDELTLPTPTPRATSSPAPSPGP